MTRTLPLLNLFGVVALAALGACQWKVGRDVNARNEALQGVVADQAVKVEEQSELAKEARADRDDFKQRLSISEGALKDAEHRLSAVTRQRDQVTAERDNLKKALDQWVAAVAERDAAMKVATANLTKLTAERDAVIARFNELGARYNVLIKDQK